MTALYRTRVARVIAAVAERYADNLSSRWAVIMGIDHATQLADAMAEDAQEAGDRAGVRVATKMRLRLAEMRAKVDKA